MFLLDDVECLCDKIFVFEVLFVVEVSYNGEESYFFVFEDSVSGELVGCLVIVVLVGFLELFYSFCNEIFVYVLCLLLIYNKIYVFLLCYDFIGNSLLISFYVQCDLVQSVYVEFNLCGCLLFMVSYLECFVDVVVVEIVGYSDEQGELLFWNVVGCNFFDLNYIEVEKFFGLKSCIFFVELMLYYLIYVLLLLDVVQEFMGQVYL